MHGAPDAQQLHPPTEQPLQSKILRTIAEFLVVALCTLAFAFTSLGVIHSLLAKDAAGQRDFVEYWASGQLLAHHANPYDSDSILRVERIAGYPTDIPPIIMGNAPPALLLVFPLGFLGPMPGELLWSFVLLASLVASVWLVRALHGSPKSWLPLLGYSFGPAMSCVLSGQMSMLVLLGLALFLYLHRSRPLLAGASLWLCALKPQLFLPFGVALLVWIVVSRRYRILVGALAVLAASAAVILLLDPQVWAQYRQMMGSLRYDRGVMPCLSNLLRRSIAPDVLWLQYLPSGLGCIWALSYFRRHRDDWNWTTHGSLLMLVSVLVAPYTWLTDQVVLIPALLHGLYETRSRVLVAALALASASVQLSIFGGGSRLLHSNVYLWTAPAWLAWYLLAARSGESQQTPAPAMLRDCMLSADDA